MSQPKQQQLQNQLSRINKFIAERSEYSRRKGDELVQQGLVFINGKKVSNPGQLVDPEKDQVTIGNKTLKSPEKIYIALNKPKNFVTTLKDEGGKAIIISLVPKNKNLKPVGRLDKDSEGLIFLTNDGEFIYKLTHPKFQCEKEYHIECEGLLTKEKASQLEKGIILEGKKTAPAKIQIIKATKDQTTAKITIHEGRNRQVRKMFAQIGHPVKYLQRIRIGKVKLGNLKLGKYRYLTQAEINAY